MQIKLTSPYNPTANSVSERRNKEIGLILRLSKHTELDRIPKLVKKRMNLCANRITNLSPFETVNEYSALDSLKRSLTREVQIGFEKRKESMKKTQDKKNKNRVQGKFFQGAKVFKKAVASDKTQAKWKGPFPITKVIKENIMEIDEGTRTSQQNIKNLRPFEG
eukprot:GAHX01006047.1.p1 GENE.GAHX01006047.1~~GAHX01006047.1.p1  ORF type:complete len:164 (+),score=34.82 GAHX01006047.1:104-595(+)